MATAKTCACIGACQKPPYKCNGSFEELYPDSIVITPKTEKFYIISNEEPFFCFSGDTLDEVIEKAKKAMKFT